MKFLLEIEKVVFPYSQYIQVGTRVCNMQDANESYLQWEIELPPVKVSELDSKRPHLSGFSDEFW